MSCFELFYCNPWFHLCSFFSLMMRLLMRQQNEFHCTDSHVSHEQYGLNIHLALLYPYAKNRQVHASMCLEPKNYQFIQRR
jgi:hypothetical protein